VLLPKERKRRTLYHDLLNIPEGKEMLADMAHRHYMFTTTHVPGDPHYTAFNEGRRSVVVELLQLANISLSELQATLKRQETDGRSESSYGSNDYDEF